MIISSVKYYTAKGVSHKHFHDSHQLLYVKQGLATIRINDRESRIKEGELVIIGRFEKHSVTPETPDFKRYAVRISDLSQNTNLLYSVFSNRPDGFSNIFDISENKNEVLRIFELIAKEFESRAALQEDMQKLLIDRLLILLYRNHPQMFEYVQDENFEKITALQRRFEKEYSFVFTLEQIAAQNNMSVSYLSHCFKRITGSSVMGYLLKCRLSAAKKMLTHSHSTVGEIVDACGFSDPSNFSRTFKENTGLTPSQFRKKYSI